jgi:hypothetical protein
VALPGIVRLAFASGQEKAAQLLACTTSHGLDSILAFAAPMLLARPGQLTGIHMSNVCPCSVMLFAGMAATSWI